MPIWGWVCVGLAALAVVGAFAFWLFVWRPIVREGELVAAEGETVVGKILFCNDTLFDEKDPNDFEAAFVVFTRDCDASVEHLAVLDGIIRQLKSFEPDEDVPEQVKLAKALETQRTVGTVLKIPKRYANGREAYLATPNVDRKLLPEGKITRDYLFVKFLYRDDCKGCDMVEYPKMAKRL
jgi:hypothetical protein